MSGTSFGLCRLACESLNSTNSDAIKMKCCSARSSAKQHGARVCGPPGPGNFVSRGFGRMFTPMPAPGGRQRP
eukprot:9479247-Pyramimonas_sp.AAC.1